MGGSGPGVEWILDVGGCRPAALRNRAGFERLFRRIVRSLKLRGIGSPLWHRFPKTGGLTGVWILAESHVTVHTFPEHASLCFNLFCCKLRPDPDWSRALAPLGNELNIRARRTRRRC